MDAYRLPNYARRTNEVVPEPPYTLENGLFFNFVFKCDPLVLQKLVNDRINAPTGFKQVFESTSPYITAIFAYYPRVYPIGGAEENGYLTYKELIIMAMVREKRAWWQKPADIVSIQPIIVLDNVKATVIGREIFGYAKVMGDIGFPTRETAQDLSVPHAFTADTVDFTEYGPEAEASNQTLIRIDCPRDFTVEELLSQTEDEPEELINRWLNRQLRSDKESGMSFGDTLAKIHRLPVLTYRQFPDPEAPGSALYKALLQTNQRNITFHAGGIMHGDFQVDISSKVRFDWMRNMMGMDPKVIAAYWFQWSFEIHRGKELWQQGTGPVDRFVRRFDWS